ncbi:MAG: peptidylprolyl isomerase [Myxococcales bacterium]|nr:peptidylprolyl isomerase [Myxococcales bacterium]
MRRSLALLLSATLFASTTLLYGCNSCGSSTPDPASSSATSAALSDPSLANEQAPAKYRAKFTTTKGVFVVEVERALAPAGADRFFNLVKCGFFDGTKFFRAVDGFMVQWGIHGTPSVASAWRKARIQDDPVKSSNTRGAITFAMAGPNTRTTQVFISFGDNSRLDPDGFASFGKVVEGMDVVDSLYKGYGEGAPRGRGPDQGRIQQEGNAYLDAEFPKLDAVKHAEIVP